GRRQYRPVPALPRRPRAPGNHPGRRDDYLHMDCDRARSALSAELDGEDPAAPRAAVDAHLTTCAACRDYAAGAAPLHRAAGAAPAEPVPDLTGPIMAAIGEPSSHPAVDERVQFLRITVAIIGVIQLAMAVPALVLGDDAGLPTHVARHLGSFAVAL